MLVVLSLKFPIYNQQYILISIPTCKPLSLLNGRIDCKKDGKMLSRDGRFQQGAECTNSCSVGFILRKNAPIAKKCICRGRNGCKWVRNAQEMV